VERRDDLVGTRLVGKRDQDERPAVRAWDGRCVMRLARGRMPDPGPVGVRVAGSRLVASRLVASRVVGRRRVGE
jgi:hypothetical protein